VGKEQGSLPLLQFALTELWEKRDSQKHQLTVEQYRVMGGVIGALDRHAEAIYQSFTEQEQEWIRRIFLKLVRTGEGQKDTRQRQPKAKLLAIGSDSVISDVLDELIQGRLLVSGEEGVDLSHEALMEGWQGFAQWRKENRELRRLIDRLEDALQEWQKNPQDENLMMGGLLAQVREKWQELELDLDVAAREFYQRSDAYDKPRSRILIEHRLREQAARVQNLLPVQPLDGLVLAIQLMGENLEKIPEQILALVKINLQRAIEADRELFVCLGHEHTVYSVAFSPDGQMIVSGGADNTLRLWDIQGNPIGQPFQDSSLVASVAFSPDGQMIASGSSAVRLWDIQGNPIGQPFIGHENGVNSVAFSPDGQMIVSGSADKTMRLWDIQGNPIGQPFMGHEDEVRSVAFSPDGQMIVSSWVDKTIRLWDIQGNPIGQAFQGHESYVWSAAFSPDGQMIVSGSADKTVRLWDIQGSPIGQPFMGHEHEVLSVAFSPDGQMIVSGSDDKTVRLWDLQGNPIGQPFQGHEESIISVAFSPDGHKIVSGSHDGTVRLWRSGWQVWLKAACDKLRDHPVFTNSQTEEAKAACETCRKYVWDA
jgi:predicted NACHT family NTPase